ncbi:hypothetical protein AC578_8302 [Pseudocercospora eumusae]|uniref:Uncharacterized protein n=1 Tax=Pseudocercospora eumusae TaxID=321146 RepID=A0A139GYY0_9PEZI|nr:hypothetical protein AC578_8302 [Pseudocercospora eumusae]
MDETPAVTAVRSRGEADFGAVDEVAVTWVVANVRDVDSVAVDKVVLRAVMKEVLVAEICSVVRDDMLRAESVLLVDDLISFDVLSQDEDLLEDVLVVEGCLLEEVLLTTECVLTEDALVDEEVVVAEDLVLRDLVAVTTNVTGLTVDSLVDSGLRVTTLVSTSVVIAAEGTRKIDLTSISDESLTFSLEQIKKRGS